MLLSVNTVNEIIRLTGISVLALYMAVLQSRLLLACNIFSSKILIE